jgi:hypothetical protein
MSYFNDECGAQTFLDVDAPCGEEAGRACANGEATQNSYRMLAANVGLRADEDEPEAAAADPWDTPAIVPDMTADDDADDDDDAETAVPSPRCSGSSAPAPTASARSWRSRRRWN